MKLAVKLVLALAGTLAVGLMVCAFMTNHFLNREAHDQAVENGRLVLEAARAARNYTSKHITPLLENQLKYEFFAEAVPAFSAVQMLGAFQHGGSPIGYREVALNPTNPRARAADWEAGVVNRFRADEKLKELVGESDTPGGRMLYLAWPIKVTDASCLQCHGTAEAAPHTMLDKYGRANGFGWQLNETIGAQFVSMPSSERRERAAAAWRSAMVSLGAVFATLFLALSVMLTWLFVRPVSRLAAMADKVSLDDDSSVRFQVRGKDEIAVLTRAFERIRTSLNRAMTMIDD
jgi:HAMP domain-containing protein